MAARSKPWGYALARKDYLARERPVHYLPGPRMIFGEYARSDMKNRWPGHASSTPLVVAYERPISRYLSRDIRWSAHR